MMRTSEELSALSSGNDTGHVACLIAPMIPHESRRSMIAEITGFRTKNLHILRTALWVAVAGLIAFAVYLKNGKQCAVEFATAYIVEYSLSVDNLFVFMIIFKYFRVSDEAQETALTWGVVGAVLLRGSMIFLGAALVERFRFVKILLAVIVMYSSAKLLFSSEDEEDENMSISWIVRETRALFPCTDEFDGTRFFIVDGDGHPLATPLLLVLIIIEISDAMFALDSVPAVLGLSKNYFVIYASNIVAVMGLRSLYFVVNEVLKNMRFLEKSLAIVLGFIGTKMILSCVLKIEISIVLSLALVLGTLFIGVVLSVLFPISETESAVDNGTALDEECSTHYGTWEQKANGTLSV